MFMNRKIFNYCFAATISAIALLSGGCANISPGKLTDIQPIAEPQNPRVGSAYLFRGFIGVFSTGMNSLNDELVEQGVRAHVFQADQWASVADTIAERYRAQPGVEPIVLVGHSYGADNIVRIAQRLKDQNVSIDLLITLDAVTPPKVPHNVKKAINLYQSNGPLDNLPWLRGIPLEAERPGSVMLVNQNIRTDRTDLLEDGTNHFNIEKKEKIHDEVIKQIKLVCVPRPVWAARKSIPTTALPALSSKTINSPTTAPSQARLE